MPRVVGGVLVVLVERGGPRRLLRRGIDFDGAPERADRRHHLARDVADGAVRCQCDASRAAVAVLGDRLMGVQVQRDDQRARAVRRREREGLPATRAEAQRGVLKLRLGRGERRRQLAEDLRVRVERVAGRAPRFVRDRRPFGGHRRQATTERRRNPTGAVEAGASRWWHVVGLARERCETRLKPVVCSPQCERPDEHSAERGRQGLGRQEAHGCPGADAARAGHELTDRLPGAAGLYGMLRRRIRRLRFDEGLANEARDVVAGECPGRLERGESQHRRVQCCVFRQCVSPRLDSYHGDGPEIRPGDRRVSGVRWSRAGGGVIEVGWPARSVVTSHAVVKPGPTEAKPSYAALSRRCSRAKRWTSTGM